jgi:hypothetical protein
MMTFPTYGNIKKWSKPPAIVGFFRRILDDQCGEPNSIIGRATLPLECVALPLGNHTCLLGILGALKVMG